MAEISGPASNSAGDTNDGSRTAIVSNSNSEVPDDISENYEHNYNHDDGSPPVRPER